MYSSMTVSVKKESVFWIKGLNKACVPWLSGPHLWYLLPFWLQTIWINWTVAHALYITCSNYWHYLWNGILDWRIKVNFLCILAGCCKHCSSLFLVLIFLECTISQKGLVGLVSSQRYQNQNIIATFKYLFS